MRSNSILFPSCPSPSNLPGGYGRRSSYMMPSRTTFSIRRFISTRKTHDDDEVVQYHVPVREDAAGLRPVKSMDVGMGKGKGKEQWTSPKAMGKLKKQPVPVDVIRRDMHQISSIPPQPGTPHSSKSSLCSCDMQNGIDIVHPRSSPRRAGSSSPPLCGSASSKDSPLSSSMGSSHPRSSSSLRDDAQYYSSARSSESKDEMDTHHTIPEPRFEFDERLLLPSSDSKHDTIRPIPRGTSKPLPDTPPSDPPNKVEQFEKETEEAFRLALPLDEAQLSEFCERVTSVQPQPLKSPASPQFRRSLRSPTAPLKSPTTPVRAASISKQKRRNSKKTRRRSSRQPTIMNKASAIFTENTREFKDMLNYKIFNRIEVDEMLSAEKLREIRQSRIAGQPNAKSPSKSPSRSPNRSTETLKSAGTDSGDTPLEPFHMDDLPVRIGAAGVKLNQVESTENVVTPKSQAMPSGEYEVSPVSEDDMLPMQGTMPVSPERAKPKPASLKLFPADPPNPPSKNPARFGNITPKPLSPKKQLPSLPLPTIPEVTATAGPSGRTPSQSRHASRLTPIAAELLPPTDDDDFVFLPSTLFSITSPGIRHGRIRLVKADLKHSQNNAANAGAINPDDTDATLDWTAFQMAISGGAGDLFAEATDFGRASDEDLEVLDSIVRWFDSFGFEGPGALVADDAQYRISSRLTSPRKSKVRNSGSSTGSNANGRRSGRSSRSGSRQGHARSGSGSKNGSGSAAFMNAQVADAIGAATATDMKQSLSDSGMNGGPVRYPHQHSSYQHQASRSVGSMDQMTPRAASKPFSASAGKASGSGSHLTIDSALANSGRRERSRHHRSGSRSQQEAHQSEFYDDRRPSTCSVDSLPQSPMMDLVVSKDANDNEYMVPMGYNLDHDLGDYLQWEAEHVFGAGYYGTMKD